MELNVNGSQEKTDDPKTPIKDAGKKNKRGVTDRLRDSSQQSSLEIINYFSKDKVYEKILWTITIIISILLCCINIRDVWVKWSTSPIIIAFNERLVPVENVSFPSVTICPQKRIDKFLYNYSYETSFYHDLYHEMYYPYNVNVTLNSTVTERLEKFDNIKLVCEGADTYNLYGGGPGNILESKITNNHVLDDIVDVFPRIYNNYSVLSMWQGKPCTNILKIVRTSEGLCYNFNSLAFTEMYEEEERKKNDYIHRRYTDLLRLKERKEYRFRFGGTEDYDVPSQGWSIENGYSDDAPDYYPFRGAENSAVPDLSILIEDTKDNKDSMCNVLNDGFKVYLHHPTDVPQASIYYYSLLPNEVTSLALSFNMVSSSKGLENYRTEVRKCYLPNERRLKYYRVYTASNCELECLSNFTYEKCDCVQFDMPFSDTEHYCSVRSIDCIFEAKKMLSVHLKNERGCNCLPTCSSVTYEAEVLKTKYNLRNYLKSRTPNRKEELNEYLDHRQYSTLQVFFKKSSYVGMHRREVFGLTDFLGYIGGLLGLFLGFSVLTLFEILYFVTFRLWRVFKRNKVTEEHEQVNIEAFTISN